MWKQWFVKQGQVEIFTELFKNKIELSEKAT